MRRNPKIRWTLAALAAVGGFGCGPDQPPVLWEDLESCPHYWSRLARPGDTIAPIAGANVDVPEYNDCQRLVAAGASTFGPLSAVFASARLDRLVADQQAASTAAGRPMAVSAATVLLINGSFPELGFQSGANCLYLWQVGDSWSARVLPVPGGGRACRQPLDPASGTGTPLSVQTVPPGAGPALPFVARWERDAGGGQAVGLRCDTQWCSIGRAGFAPSPDITFAPDPTFTTDALFNGWLAGLPGSAGAVTVAQLRTLATVRGWYDDQFLAPAGGGPGPSALWAAVMPHPGLDAIGAGNFADWQVTGLVWIPTPGTTAAAGTLAEYGTKFNFGAGWNAIALCSSAGPACFPTGAPPACPALAPGEERWFGMVRRSAGGADRFFCIRRIPNFAGHTIGTARWRWIKNDDTVWMRCVEGCCELET